MSVGVAFGLVCGLLGQVVEEPDSLEVAFRRVQRRLTERALSGQVSALAHDRAVAVLINRVQETRGAIREAQQRQRDVGLERRVLSSIRLEDLTETARARHLERISQLDATLEGLHRAEEASCRVLGETFAELKGRIEGKVDTLRAAQATCGTPVPEWCGGLSEALDAFVVLGRSLNDERPAGLTSCAAWPGSAASERRAR